MSAESIMVDGLERTYILHVPKGYYIAEQIPLVIVLHGGGGQGKGMIKLSGMNKTADKYKFIVVYPDGIDNHWNDGREVNKSKINGNFVDDVHFISCLIDSLKNKYNIDSNRVFVTGISNGGIMSFRLACELPNKICAIAPVAASMTVEESTWCKPLQAVPIMIIFGDEDPLIPFEGGEIGFKFFKKRGKVIPVEKTVEFWVKNNNCNPIPTVDTIDHGDDDTRAIRYEYKGDGNLSRVTFWLIEGGGHTWPGGYQYLPKIIVGRTSKQINASEEIWKFFSEINK